MIETAIPITSSFNTFDISLLIIIGVSALFGLLMGFTKQILSIGSWLGAFTLSFYGYSYVIEFTREFIHHPFISMSVTYSVLFLIALTLLTLVTKTIADNIKHSRLNSLDRSLGLLFSLLLSCTGIVGLFLISALVWKTPEARPNIIQYSQSLPFISDAAIIMARFIPKNYISEDFISRFTTKASQTAHELMINLANPVPKDIDSDLEKGSKYKNEQRQEMNRLFQNYAE